MEAVFIVILLIAALIYKISDDSGSKTYRPPKRPENPYRPWLKPNGDVDEDWIEQNYDGGETISPDGTWPDT